MLENVSRALYGIIIVAFLIFGLLPFMWTAMSLATISDPILQLVPLFFIVFFAAIVVWIAFFHKEEPKLPRF